MKKYIVSILVASMFLVCAPFVVPKASAADMSIVDFINLLITIGVIAPDKIPAVNAYLATLDKPINPIVQLTTQQINEYSLKANRLNKNRDFSLVENSINYMENIGLYNNHEVQFAFKCWGDVCPYNGAFFLAYKDISRDACPDLGGFVVEGYSGWGSNTYGGCSPVKLSN